MAIYTNILKDYQPEIKKLVTVENFDNLVDHCINHNIIDEELSSHLFLRKLEQEMSLKRWYDILFNYILEDTNRCFKFIKSLRHLRFASSVAMLMEEDIDRIYQAIVIGGFPEFSTNYIVRNSVADVIRRNILDLDVHHSNVLLIHGLPGLGKSSLVNQVLQTRSINSFCNGAMFWIPLGEHQDKSNIINPLWSLYLNAIKCTDKIPIRKQPEEILFLQSELRSLFLSVELRNAIVVLDDVKSSEVLDLFKLPCKLIVTTTDRDVAVNARKYKDVHVSHGFKQEESHNLFRISLDTNNLCDKVQFINKIHKLCHGCPMLLSIMCSLLKYSREEALYSNNIWNALIDSIKENNNFENAISKNVVNMIERCVERLPEDQKEYFHSLALFSEHVNIRPEILKKLWNLSQFDVRKVMVELENKSLITSFFDKDLKTYIYSLHTLVFQYLRTSKKAQENLKKYHEQLITHYIDIIDNPLVNDPSVNYIFGYFGYHVKRAELFEYFEKYFDLNFIENKIKHVGSNDILNDYDLYRDHITQKDPSKEKKIEDLISIIRSYSKHLLTSPETNIVQFTIAFSNESNYAYQEAQRIADSDPHQLYFRIDSYSEKCDNFINLEIRRNITSVCFLSPDEVLVGTASGLIKTLTINHYQTTSHNFEGHRREVFHLELNKDKNCFLSFSHDSTAKLWQIEENLDPQSPKCKQINWVDVISPDKTNDCITFAMDDGSSITCGAFTNGNVHEIVTGTNEGGVVRWKTKNGEKILEAAKIGSPIKTIIYSHNNDMIIFGYNDNIVFFRRSDFSWLTQFSHSQGYCQLLLVPNHFKETLFVAVTENCTELWKYSSKIVKREQVIEKTKMKTFDLPSKITCVSLYDRGLLLGTQENSYVYQFYSGSLTPFKNNFGSPQSICMSLDHLVLVCFNNNTLQRYEVSLEPKENFIIRDLSLFSAYWINSVPSYVIVNQNQFDLYQGHSNTSKQSEVFNEKITSITFSLKGEFLIFGTEQGAVHFYSYKRRRITTAKIFSGPVTRVQCLEDKTVDVNAFRGVVVAVCDKTVAIINNATETELFQVDNDLSKILFIHNHLIMIDVKNKICVRDILFNEVIEMEAVGPIADVAINQQNCLLGVACEDGFLHIYKLELGTPLNVQNYLKTDLVNKPKSICFSFNGGQVAIGCHNGKIQVIDIKEKLRKGTVYNDRILTLHKTPVEQLIFSSTNDSVLMSLGDQIACWNVTPLLACCRPSGSSSDSDNYYPWTNKKFHDTVPYLLASTILCSKQLKYISASKDFSAFLVVDNNGNIYKVDFFTTFMV